MTQHFTRNTVSAAAWCAKCQRSTMHRVDGVKLGPCLVCIEKLDQQHAHRGNSAATQIGLLDREERNQLPRLVVHWPRIWRELWEERVAIMEIEGGMPRIQAEKEAEQDIRRVARDS